LRRSTTSFSRSLFATGETAKPGLSTWRFSFQSERDPTTKETGVCCLLGHTPVEISGHIPEGSSQRVFRDNPPSDLIGHQDEIGDWLIQMFEKVLDPHPNLFFGVLEMMIEIPKPHREAIDDSHFRASRQIGEHTGKFNGLLDGAEMIAPLFAMPGNPLFHLLIKGYGRGDENAL
jgi:hypothetical protein